MPLHHVHAKLDGSIVLQVGTIAQDVRCHGIGQCFYDAWDDKQQTPQEDIDPQKEFRSEDTQELTVAVAIEKMADVEGIAILTAMVRQEGHRKAPGKGNQQQSEG